MSKICALVDLECAIEYAVHSKHKRIRKDKDKETHIFSIINISIITQSLYNKISKQNVREITNIVPIENLTIEKIRKLKILKPEEFKSFKEIFGWEGNSYCSYKDINLFDVFNEYFLCKEAHHILDQIRIKMEKRLPKDEYDNYLEIHYSYECIIDDNNSNLCKINEFLIEWNYNLQLDLGDFVPINYDKNLISIIDTYINYNNFIMVESVMMNDPKYIEKFYFFFNNNNNLIVKTYSLDKMIQREKMGCVEYVPIIKYMQKLNLDVCYMLSS